MREKRGEGDPKGEVEETPGPPVESEGLCYNQQRYKTYNEKKLLTCIVKQLFIIAVKEIFLK